MNGYEYQRGLNEVTERKVRRMIDNRAATVKNTIGRMIYESERAQDFTAAIGKVQHENGSCPDIYFNQRGNRGVGCGLEAVQKICDGEALGGTPVDVDEAFGDSEAYLADSGYPQPVNGNMQQQAQQAALGHPVQQGYAQPVQGYGQAAAPAAPLQQGYPQPVQAGYPAPQYPVQQGGYQQPQPPMQGAVNTFANNVAVANSILPPQLFGEGQQSKVA